MDQSTKEKILSLYKSGNSIKEVAQEVDYHRSTVYRKIKDAGINRSMSEAAQKKELSESHKEAIKQGMADSDKNIGSDPASLKDGYEDPTEELGYFIGAMLGDGYIVSQGGVGLENKDKEFIDEFARVIEDQFGFEPQIYKREADEMKDWKTGNTHERSKRWILRKKSVKLRDFCQSLDKDWVVDKDEEIQKAWIRGLWDSDGCVSAQSVQVYLYNKDKELMEIYEKILSEVLDIEAKHYDQGDGVYKSYFGTQDQIETFYKEIKPTIQRKKDNFQKILDIQEN